VQDCIAQISDLALSKLECYPSLEDFFGENMDGWRMGQFNENKAYTIAVFTDGPTSNAPSMIFHKNKDNQQCLILHIPFSDNTHYKFSSDNRLIEVIATEHVFNIYRDIATEIVFKLNKDGYFISSECRKTFFLTKGKKSYPCDTEPNEISLDEADLDLYPPSFDCIKANSRAEKIICSRADIAILDSALNLNYLRIISNLADKHDQVVSEQKAWLKQRNSCVTSKCLIESYRNRLNEICDKYSDKSGMSFDCLTTSTLQL
jgi:uncharacterized protein YecT (DUF1311 family)